MTALDLGCGPSFFTIDMAEIVGINGRIIAADQQAGMLAKLQQKTQGTVFEGQVVLHTCKEDRIGLEDEVDFILAFYVLHEIPQQGQLFTELASLLKADVSILVLDPPFHVSKKAP